MMLVPETNLTEEAKGKVLDKRGGRYGSAEQRDPLTVLVETQGVNTAVAAAHAVAAIDRRLEFECRGL